MPGYATTQNLGLINHKERQTDTETHTETTYTHIHTHTHTHTHNYTHNTVITLVSAIDFVHTVIISMYIVSMLLSI
jgi:hypothetical protein